MYRINPIILFLALATFLSSCENTQEQPAFQLSPQETLNMATTGGYWITPGEARNWQKEHDDAYRFIDIRSSIQFDKGSLEGAINIPIPNLLEQENRALFSGNATTNVLFGETEADAHGAWLLLRQMGYSNMLLLQGGYDFQQLPDSIQYLPPEQARFDYAALMVEAVQREKAEDEATRPKAAPQRIVKTPKQIVPQKKAKPKVAEEEGC